MKMSKKILVGFLALGMCSIASPSAKAAVAGDNLLISTPTGDISISFDNIDNAECTIVDDAIETAEINSQIEKSKDALLKTQAAIDAAKEQLNKSRNTLNSTTNTTEKQALSTAITKLANAILTLTSSKQKLDAQIEVLMTKKKEIVDKVASNSLGTSSYEICSVPVSISWNTISDSISDSDMQALMGVEIAIGEVTENHLIKKYANQQALTPFKSLTNQGKINGNIKVLRNLLGEFSVGISLGSLPAGFKLMGGTSNVYGADSTNGSSPKQLEIQSKSLSKFGFIYDSSNYLWLDPLNRDSEGRCKFGFSEDDAGEKCLPIAWKFSNRNDGFNKWISLVINSADDEFSTGDQSQLEITCTNKKLAVNVYFEFPDSFGWKGAGQYRIDNGSGKKFTYTVDKSISYIWVDAPKVLTSSLLKSKEKVSFRLVNSYARILVFPKSDLSKWANKFRSVGCPLS